MPTRYPALDLTEGDVLEMDDDTAIHLPTVRAAREIRRRRATDRILDGWASELEASGSATNLHFARILREKLRGS